MIGFEHNRLADVNLITDNLRDRYKDPFSILKELVQNADDAGAGQLRFGVAPGSEEHPHPLLQGPGLVVVNDGAFTRKDFRAICSFGLNSKAADSATIGKFGLGMKSVFHLCEALFFIAEGEGNLYRELLSPWGELRLHWDVSGPQSDTLMEVLRRRSLVAVDWESEVTPFILYLPLRRKAQLDLPDGQTAGAIIEDYPGDTGRVSELLRSAETGARLGSLLPLLRNVSDIRVYLPVSERESGLVHGSELEPNSARPLRHHAEGQSKLSSVVKMGSRHLLFTGLQRYQFTERLTEIHQSNAWPASWVRDDLGHAQQAPDKAQPHAAAVFGQEKLAGSLTIRWAVFLPIEEHEERVEMLPGMGGYSLTVHGHFFVDAGRNGLYGLDSDSDTAVNGVRDEAWVRRNWN